MANAKTIRRILVNTIKSIEDSGANSAKLGFFNSTSSAAHQYNMNLTSSIAIDNKDVMTQRDFEGNFKPEIIRIARPSATDAYTQTYTLPINDHKKVATGSVCMTINGLEQVSSDTQLTSGSGVDFFLTGSNNELLKLYKSRQDHSGLTVDNLDNVIITYKTENVIG